MKLTCIMCPLGCELDVVTKGDDIKVSGNTCLRGETYAKTEQTRPMRAVSSLVKAEGMAVPVKTSGLVPKDKIGDILNELAKISLDKYPEFGTVIIKNILNLDVDIISIGY